MKNLTYKPIKKLGHYNSTMSPYHDSMIAKTITRNPRKHVILPRLEKSRTKKYGYYINNYSSNGKWIVFQKMKLGF